MIADDSVTDAEARGAVMRHAMRHSPSRICGTGRPAELAERLRQSRARDPDLLADSGSGALRGPRDPRPRLRGMRRPCPGRLAGFDGPRRDAQLAKEIALRLGRADAAPPLPGIMR